MKLLLDTQVLLWSAGQPGKLSKAIRTELEEPGNEILFSAGYPTLALALGAAIITVFIFVVLHDGLLAGITALTTHFFLMTAPTTLDFSNWWAPVGLWYIGSVALSGLGGCYLARSGRTWKPERAYSLQRA